jgi:Heme/copper-type cytochrome/quinol oxidases, subunit 2
MNQLRHKSIVFSACMAAGLLAASLGTSFPARAQGAAREFTINADQFAFAPARIEVQKDDLVKITLTAKDIAHSFTIDQYRIAKRAAAGQTVTFEFRADQVGTHRFYCNLTQDDRCRKMEGTLVVR